MQEVVQKQLCMMCKKELSDEEGFVSSDGVAVCSEDCKEVYQTQYEKTPKLTVYSRVTGYCTPISSWNKGKMREFKDRQKYKV